MRASPKQASIPVPGAVELISSELLSGSGGDQILHRKKSPRSTRTRARGIVAPQNSGTGQDSDLRARILYEAMMAAGDRLLEAMEKEQNLTLRWDEDGVFDQWKVQRETVGELSQRYIQAVSRWREAIEEAAR
jgi:hypothetical protein